MVGATRLVGLVQRAVHGVVSQDGIDKSPIGTVPVGFFQLPEVLCLQLSVPAIVGPGPPGYLVLRWSNFLFPPENCAP